MKRIILIILSVILCFQLTACGAPSGEKDVMPEDIINNGLKSNSNSDFIYEVISDANHSARITGYQGSATSIKIPTMIDGYTIVRIEGLLGGEMFKK